MDVNKIKIIPLLCVGILFAVWDTYVEIDLHYLEPYNGIVLKKLQIPPKKMPDLVIRGAKETFPCWKWEGINFDSVKLGDSIVKKKYDYFAYYYKRTNNGKYIKVKLSYWTL